MHATNRIGRPEGAGLRPRYYTRVEAVRIAEDYARSRAFPPQAVLGPAFTPGCHGENGNYKSQARLRAFSMRRALALWGRHAQEPRKRGWTQNIAYCPPLPGVNAGSNTAGATRAVNGPQRSPARQLGRNNEGLRPWLSTNASAGLSNVTLRCLVALAVVLAWNSPGYSQSPAAGGTKAAFKAEPAGAVNTASMATEGIPSTLDEALAAAMERNPNIITAQAKARLAEAELNAVRMETAGKIATLWSELRSQEELLASAEARFKSEEHLNKVGGEPKTYPDAKTAMIDAAAKLARTKSALRYMIGVAVSTNVSTNNATTTDVSCVGRLELLPKPAQLPRGPMVEKVRQALLAPTQMEFVDTPFFDVVDYLKAYHEIEIQLDEHSFPMAQKGFPRDTKMTFNLKGISLAAAIQAIEDQYPPLRFVVRDYGILITERERAREEGYFTCEALAKLGELPWGPAVEKIRQALGSPTEIEFVDTPLSDAVDYLMDRHGIQIQIDTRALTDAGVGTDTPVTRRLKGTTLRSALRLLLHEVGLTYLIQDEVLLITTPEEAEDRMKASAYPVDDSTGPAEIPAKGGKASDKAATADKSLQSQSPKSPAPEKSEWP